MHAGRRATLAWRGFDLAECRIYGARLRRRKVWPLFTPSIHRHSYSEPDRSFNRAAGPARDVVLCSIRALQPEGRNLGRKTRRVWRHGDRYYRRTRAKHERNYSSSAGLNSARSGARVWPVGRKYLSGRTDSGAAFLSAARARLGTVSFANSQSLYVWFSDASGRRHHGRQREKCGDGDFKG